VSAQFLTVGQLAVMAGSLLALSAATAASTGTDRPWTGHVETQTRSLEGRRKWASQKALSQMALEDIYIVHLLGTILIYRLDLRR